MDTEICHMTTEIEIRYGNFHCACRCVSLEISTLIVVSNVLQWISMAFTGYPWPILTPDVVRYGPMNFKFHSR